MAKSAKSKRTAKFNLPIKYHHHFDTWSKQAERVVTLSKSMQRKLGYYLPKIMLGDLIGYVKNIPINS